MPTASVFNSLIALNPLDGRYRLAVESLAPFFSEFALIRHRLIVEVAYFMALSAEKGIGELPPFTDAEMKRLHALVTQFDETEAEAVKQIEKETKHDVKAVEYYMKEKLKKTSLKKHLEFIHFAATSEDINNLAYGLMLKEARTQVLLPAMESIYKTLMALARKWKRVPLLALTHGQSATPTTVGKELHVFAMRLQRQAAMLKNQPILGKFNGATGNFNAHLVAYPQLNWKKLSKNFVQNLGLTWNEWTTQIEPHDSQSEFYDNVARFNAILCDLARDLWLYISRGIFAQRVVQGEVGSSTMPHKVNPIDFENAEGNLGLANALLRHFSEKLLQSRLQRDLTDSTVQRNIGTALGYSLLAYQSILKGFQKLELNTKVIQKELDENWALLAEPIQTILRKYAVPGAYEKLKTLTRGKAVTQETVRAFVASLPLPAPEKTRLQALTPATYLGLATDF